MAIATLPIVLAVVLTELAVGGALVQWYVDRGGRAPSGFLKLVGFVDIGAIAAALALVPTFPHGDLADRAGIDTGPLSAFGQILAWSHAAMEDGTWQRLKACASDSCRFAFYDHSKNHGGRWCDMSTCGNRAKVTAFRVRQAASRPPASSKAASRKPANSG